METWLIGGADDCDLTVNVPTVSAHHCRLTKDAGGYWLEDLRSTNGTFVNGRPIHERTQVTPNDRITLGTNVEMPWPNKAPTIHGTVITIGGAADNAIVLDFPMISAHHARLILHDGDAILEDLGATNGTYLGSHHNRISKSRLMPTDVVYFGTFRVPAHQLFEQSQAFLKRSQPISVPERGVVLGRAPTCDEVLDDVMVSRRHARILRASQGIVIEDLNSTNGTYVNGCRIDKQTAVFAGDVITVGTYSFTLNDVEAFHKHDYHGSLTIEARNLGVAVRERKLLDAVSLTIHPTEFVGLMGPSGAGKSTLMNALNGYTQPTSGVVLFNGVDLYGNYDSFRGQIGYVPQDDIVHRDLTVYQALYYNARSRLPSDYTDEEIERRVADVIKQLGLQGTESVRIGSAEAKGISGGQRKRVNLAMELLTDPSVLFLDEPTSGLSSEDALLVMRLLRQLADAGKTILMTIHQPSLEAFRHLDNLVVVAKDAGTTDPGQLAYYGPAYPDAVQYFKSAAAAVRPNDIQDSPDLVLRGLGAHPVATWVAQYKSSALRQQYVMEREGNNLSSSTSSAFRRVAPGGLRQWRTLVERGIVIKLKDSWNTAILMAQAPIIAMLIALVFGHQARGETNDVSWAESTRATAISTFLMALSAIWFGCSNSVREIVAEWAIYRRERMVNLAITWYIAAKMTVLGSLCAMQCAVLLLVVHFGNGLQSSWSAMYLILFLSALVGASLGLVISSLARSSEVAVGLLPIVIIPMVILGGILQPVRDMHWLPRSVCQLMPSRWAFEALISLEAEQRPLGVVAMAPVESGAPPDKQDIAEQYFPRKSDRVGTIASTIVLAVMGMILICGTANILRWRDIH